MQSSRKLHDWLSGYLEYTEGTESPLAYHIWTGITLIAGTLKRRTFIHAGMEGKIYPNLYTILIGPSGQARKGSALNCATPFIQESGISMPSNAITTEALIKHVVNSSSNFNNGEGQIEWMCPVTIISGELGVLLGQHDIKFLVTLTDWYDSKDSWGYETRGRGKEKISGVCVTMLGALAPDWLPSMLPDEAVGGGWSSRVIFIVEDKKRQIIPFSPVPDLLLQEKLIHDISMISNLTGKFEWGEGAEEAYGKWYETYETEWNAGNPPIPHPKFEGYCGRRGTHLRKVAMCLSASRGDDLIIHLEDFRRAVKILEAAEKKMPRAFAGMGRSDISVNTDLVLSWIKTKGKVKRSYLLKRIYEDVDMYTLERIELILSAMKVIEIIDHPNENDKTYRFIGAESLVSSQLPSDEQKDH
jgi:hypothetical protein